MRYGDYRFTRLDELERWAPANLGKAGALVTALEQFIVAGPDAGAIVGRSRDDRRQAFLVPPRAMLPQVPDACALVIVDHGDRTIILERLFDGDDASGDDLWPLARRIAEGLLES